MTKVVIGEWTDKGAVRLDVPRLVETRLLIQASSGSGKSVALREVLETTHGHVQQIIVDPEGEFASLREKCDLIIAAAHDGDVVAQPKTAKLLAIRLLETEASAVLDISELKVRERHAFVRILFESLLEAPKGLRHPVLVALDEAHLFAPEKGQGESEALDAVIDMASLGRKRGLALLAATQRIGKYHKSAAADLKNRLIGNTALDVDVKRAAFDLGLSPKEALEILRPLAAGHFYAFGPAFDQTEPRQLLVSMPLTSHPKVGHKQRTAPPKPSEAIKALLPKLADLPREAEEEARTIEELKRELLSARRELKEAQRAQPKIVAGTAPAEILAERRASAATVKRLRGVIEDLMKFVIKVNAAGFAKDAGVDPEDMQKAIDSAVAQAMKLVDAKMATRERDLQVLQRDAGRLIATAQKLLADDEVKIDVDVQHREAFAVSASPRPARTPAAPRPARASNGESANIPKGEAAVLAACIQFPDGLRREQLTVLTGYKRSSRDAYIQRLRERGFVESNGDMVTATDEGQAALPNAAPLPTGIELQEFWRARLPEGERKILDILIENQGKSVARADLDELTGYQRSSRDAYLQRLRAKQLVTEPSRGEVCASENLF